MICFFKDTATTEIYTYGHTLSLHDALPIYPTVVRTLVLDRNAAYAFDIVEKPDPVAVAELGPPIFAQLARSEEHTSELQSLMRISYAVFCLKKKKKRETPSYQTTLTTTHNLITTQLTITTMRCKKTT